MTATLTAPYVAHSDTSKEAAASIEGQLGRLEQLVFNAVEMAGIYGATCDEIETQLNLSHQTASARIRALAKLGRIADSGNRRKTRSGRNAVVWVVTI